MPPEILYSSISALISSAITIIFARDRFNRANMATQEVMRNKILELEKTIHDKQIEYSVEKIV